MVRGAVCCDDRPAVVGGTTGAEMGDQRWNVTRIVGVFTCCIVGAVLMVAAVLVALGSLDVTGDFDNVIGFGLALALGTFAGGTLAAVGWRIVTWLTDN